MVFKTFRPFFPTIEKTASFYAPYFDDLKDFRYKGHFYGGGVSYGYQFVLGRHWNLGATIGLGYAYVRYKKYECEECGDMLEKSNKNYWGPTKAALNLIYIF